MPGKENINTAKLQRIFLYLFCRRMLRYNMFFIVNPAMWDITQNINLSRCNARAYVLVDIKCTFCVGSWNLCYACASGWSNTGWSNSCTESLGAISRYSNHVSILLVVAGYVLMLRLSKINWRNVWDHPARTRWSSSGGVAWMFQALWDY